MKSTFQSLMRTATMLTRSGRLGDATATIQRALTSVSGTGASPGRAGSPTADPRINAVGFLRPLPSLLPLNQAGVSHATVSTATTNVDAISAPRESSNVVPFPFPAPIGDQAQAADGAFISGAHSHAAKTYRYKLYVPSGHVGRQLPLVVMLHGCTQDPDDFAAGTRMNEAAQEQGFFVLYPAQSQGANPSRCWNWFKLQDQQRDGGEPASIAAMTSALIAQYAIDPRRVYIAGLSAGGAMATIVAEAYPEIFSAVGVHSGLPSGSASSVLEALAVMKSGTGSRSGMTAGSGQRQRSAVPTIVFHGDHDQTVHPDNGEKVIAAVVGNGSFAHVENGVSPQGRHYTRALHRNENGKAVAEHWVVKGAGHAWSGGDAAGSYTDSRGPDATRAMLRFFFAQPGGAPDGLQH